MSALAYTRYELLRTFRERRLFIFSFGFPLILYFVIVAPNRNVHNIDGTGISLPLYYMAGLASFGTMMSMMSAGFRIAGERQAGWTRQLRITPLSPRAYLRAKVLTAYAMAGLSLGLLYIAGATLGVSLAAGTLAEDDGLIAIALLPFAALGDRARPPADRRLDRPGDRRPGVAAGDRQRHVVPGHRASCTTSGSSCPPTGSCRRRGSRPTATAGARMAWAVVARLDGRPDACSPAFAYRRDTGRV